MLSRLLGILLSLLALLVVSAGIQAHARYERSNPAPGQVLSTPPTIVEIFTTQELRRQGNANVITVEDERGNRVDNGDTRIDDTNRRRFFVTLRPNLPPGRYIVRFQTLSDEDGEADRGAFAFYIGVQPTDAQRAQDAQLHLSEEDASTTHRSLNEEGSNRALYVVGAVVVIAVIAVLGFGGWALLRSRPGKA